MSASAANATFFWRRKKSTSSVVYKFAVVEKAIRTRNYALLKTILLSSKAELTNPLTNKNILHSVCEYGDLDSLEIVFTLPQKLLIRMAKSPLLFKDDLYVPTAYLLLLDQPYTDEILQKIKTSLPPLHNFTKHLHQLIDEKETARRYPLLDQKSEAYQNLELARWIINEVRKFKFSSSNHPTMQIADAKAYDRLEAMMTLIRSIDKFQEEKKDCELVYQMVVEKKDPRIPGKFLFSPDETPVLNCDELARVGKHLLLMHQKGLNAYKNTRLCRLVPGDHLFLMIGLDEKSTALPYAEWKKSAVFCGPWEGEYCLADEIPHYLKNHFMYWSDAENKITTIASDFDAKRQTIELLYPDMPEAKLAAAPSDHQSSYSVLSTDGIWFVSGKTTFFQPAANPMKPTPLPNLIEEDEVVLRLS